MLGGDNCGMEFSTCARNMDVIMLKGEPCVLKQNGFRVWSACSIAPRTFLNGAFGLLYGDALRAPLPRREINGSVKITRLSYVTGGREERI